ncbi:Interleukin-21 receptor [Oryzias melastigma]|uniref:Interleukin-21 receptor n=1 Tax=Oryzias melastigma TaxID=30732 RepID=A0A834KXA0_ORYME|nr:Interleukin-21 receptor [Oryzias melastigma]
MSFSLRLKILLIVSSCTLRLQGDSVPGTEHQIYCTNDFVFTVNCSIKLHPAANTSADHSSSWLQFIDPDDEKENHVCRLTNTTGALFCSFKRSTEEPEQSSDPDIFDDIHLYKISLCHSEDDKPEMCELLDDGYTPVTNIRPNAPCCLTVSHNSSQYHFSWKNTYERFTMNNLAENLKYELLIYKLEHKVVQHNIVPESTSYSLDEEKCTPDSEYAARVRSSPNGARFKGEWSDWSPEVSWRTEPAPEDFTSKEFSSLYTVIISLCVVTILLILLCYGSVKRWRQNSFIPTPAPYFQTLYTDCQGDFKSWVMTQDDTADVLNVENTLQIDSLEKCAEQQQVEGSPYRNIPNHTSPNSKEISSLAHPMPGSSGEDSGCWLCSDTSLEELPLWYCNEYCTLNCIQNPGCGAAQNHAGLKKFCQPELREDLIRDA